MQTFNLGDVKTEDPETQQNFQRTLKKKRVGSVLFKLQRAGKVDFAPLKELKVPPNETGHCGR